jgi:hypothetical protein
VQPGHPQRDQPPGADRHLSATGAAPP